MTEGQKPTPEISKYIAKKTRRENPTRGYLKPGIFIEPSAQSETSEPRRDLLVEFTLRSHENE
jgi:hypothetical protein